MTKYKPLYALYKGLKEHGTDLPDSYGSFERSMTQAGNAGASNRRNFYQSLKDSNYDVPDTYEKFYESMFVPVNNTTSRARKIGETPMTEEDRKGFTLGAQDIRMNASKFAAGDALRYNKLKQRKQKQRKDFGRVKVGTNKTPYAPTDNVVKYEGLNTYVTSDSSDTTNLDYAQQKQAVLDEQNQAYMNAIERGDIPMASETIDKNGLYDLQENIGKDGTEVTEKGIKEQAEARLNVAYQKQKDIMAQLSAAMDGGFSTFEERMQLSATKNKIDEEVRNLEALAGKESSGFWNTLADVANTIPLLHNIKEGINYLFGDDTSKDMYKAIANSMVQSNWDFGVSDIQNSVKLEQIRDKINKGEAVTKEEKEFLDANQKADKSAEWVDQYGSRAYRWTSGAGVSVPYMLDFYITGGLPLMRGMTQAFGRGAMKIAAKRGWGKLAHNIMYYTGVAAGDIIGSYAMATTVQGLKTGSDVLNRHLGTLYQDEKGNYAFGTFDENGNLLHEGGESFGKALYKGVTAAMLENYTEKMFGHWHLKSGAFDLLDKNPYTKKLADFFRGVGNKNWYLDTKKFSSKFGIGSYPEEVAEEIVNIPLNAWLVGDNSIKELGDRKTWEDIAGSMAISVGSMAGMASTPHIVRGAANQGIKAYDFAAFYVFKNRLNQANQRASEILGDEWEVIKNRIDSAPNENLGKISADLHKQVSEGKYSEEQLDAAWAYIQNLRVMRGYNLAKTMEMQAKAMTGDENTPADIRQKQLNAAYAAGQETEGENKHLAQVEYEKQKFNLASALGVSDSELENMTDEQISSNLGLDDNLDNVIYNYQNAKALYDGIIDNAQNAVDTATKVAAQRVDAMTNVEDGTIKQALVKGTMGKDDYPVYVISGNIETHDDGIINYSDSDSMIIVYNVATGRKETIPVSMLSAVNPYIQNAEEFKAQAVNEAKEKTITELSNVIDGKLVDGSQFTMEDAQGQIHEYKIEGIDEQGNCIISVDGTILPEPLSLDAIQQQYDQSNVARSVKNDQTAQEPEQIQQESQPIEDKFDYAKITNENDGKVKRVDVTDEEGKNRFPNAKAVFLIQDKGAMPKFVVMDEEGNLTSYVGKRGDKIHLKGEMTIDEYKKQRQEGLQMIAAENADSSMIEENSGAIEVEDNEEGKLLNRNDDVAQTEQNQPSASVTTSQEDAAGSSESKDTNISANGNENNESLTFEDGTPIPVDVNGEVDLSQTDATHAAEWYDNNLGEDADDWLDGEIKKAKKVLEQAKNKKLAGTKPSELVASKKEKEAAIADAQAHYDSAISIRDSLKERRIAEEENTSEGRRNLIEKARRKFARLKSAVKDDAEAVSQLYRDTIGSLLHRLYDGTGIDVTDTIPLTAEEYVASNLGAHSLNYEGTETSKGVKQETGLSREDFAKTQLLAADGKGTTIDALVHSLWENRPSNLESLDTQDIRNALLSIITSGFKASEARNYIENLRIAQAENILEEQKKAADNAAFAEEQKAKQEEEDKKAEENAEEKAEEKTHSESFNKIVDLAKNLEEILDNPDNVKEIDKITHEIDELLENLSDKEFKEVSDVLLNIDEDLEYLTADEYERREGVEESKKAKAYNESLQQAIKRISPYADALKAAVKSDDKKAIAKARKELTDALLASNLGHGYLSGQLEYAKSAKKKDESYSERRALVKPLTDAIDAIESALDSALAEAGLEGVHVDFTEGGHGWIYADKGSAWSSRLKALDNDYRNVSQYETQNPISVLPQVTIDNVEKVAGIIKSRIEEGERYNSDEYNDEDEQTKFPDKLKEGSETIEVPDDATEDNPLGAQRDSAPFSPKDNTKVTNSSEERKAMVKKNAVRSEDVLDHSIGKKMRKSLSRIAKMMGADIIYLHSADSNGWYDEKTNTIYLALDSADVLGTQFVFGHEMTHEIKAKNPAAFEELKNLVKNMMGEDAFNTITDKTQQKYEKGGATYWKDRNAMEEEVVADQIGNWIHDANYAHTLMMKMSHPLLAKLHEIVNRIRFAFTGTEYSDNAKLILRSIEQAYMKTANGQVTNSETGEDVSFSLRQKPEPKKKGIGYKVFVLKDGKLYPPMVANPDGAATPVGVWLDADAAPIAGESKTGRPQVKQGGKGTQGGSGKLAYRPGWHLGVVPYAIQFNRKDAEGNKTLFPKNFVFAEVEYAADVDYQEEARQEGINPSGKYQHSLAGLKHLPTDGYYMYRTNPNPETDPWVITGAMKVNRILTRVEQADLVSKAGREPQQIQEGDIVTDDVVNSINQEIADTPKFSLKVYHGSGADFTEFDFDHMGEGAGSQVFGWGGYVTSSKKIGKSYANLVDANAPHQDVEYVGNNAHEYTDVVAGLFNGGQRDYDDVKEFLQNGYNSDKDNARKKQMLEWFESTKPSDWKSVNDGKRNLYEVNIPEDNGSNYLEWEKTLTEKQINAIRDALAKNGVDISSFEKRGFKLDLPFKYVYTTVLPMMMHSKPKDVSKFLSSLGFTGIKYPAGTIMGGAEEGDTNYVIFKPEDMKITQHTKFSLKSKPVRFETGKKLSDEEKKEVLSTLKDAYKVNGVPYHIEETAGGKEKRVYEPTADSYVVSDITNRPLRYYITLPDGRVAHPTEVYPNISDNEVKSSATKQGLLDDEADQIVSAAIGNMKGIADNAKVLEVLTEMQNLQHETHDVGYGMNNAQSYNYKTGIFTSDAAQAIDYVVRRMRRKEDVPAEIPAALKKAVDDSYGMVDNLIDGMSNTKVGAAEIKPVGVGAFGNIYNQFRGKAKAAIEFLKKVRGGEAVGALYHKDIGDIDLVWGKEGTGHSDGYGLSKLVKYHPEVLDNLQEILNDMRVVSSSKNRVNLESETHKAGVRLTWDGERKSWLLTAFKKETSASDKRTDTAATSLEGDTALSQTEGSAAKIDNSSETTKKNGEKFSLKDEKTLAGVHNISEEKLLKAIKQGGLANPSVAVIDSSRQDHKAYGGISLILPSDKIAKRTGKNAGTWQGDAYTPTYPEVEKQMSNKGAEKSSSDVLSVPKEMQHEVRNGIDRWLNGGDANSGLKYLFLHEKGVAPEPKKIQPKFSDEAYNELKFITAGDFNIYGIGKADAQKVLDMYIEAKFDGDKDLYEEKTKAWLERNKSIVDAGAKGGMRYAIAKENVELYDEYGFNYKGVQTFVRDVEYDHRKSGVDTNATLNEVEDYIKTNNLTDEFNTWLEGKEKEYGIKEVIFDGFTPSGNRRYVPNTLENVSKLMKKQGRNGATGAAVSFQNFAARLMPSYGTLKDIRSKKGLLTSDREKFDKFREKWSNVFFELGMKCQPDATGTFDDYGLARLSEAAMTSDPQAYLKKEYNVDFSDEDTKRLKEMVKAIKEEHPAMYFETKFERPVRFDEFSAAVVPTTTKKEVKEALKNAGVSIFEYDEKSDADRKRAFNEAINSRDNIRFSLAGERGAAAADKAEERTFRMDNLSVARKMEEKKKDAKAIKMATGWERGADGKWRYEMPDAKIKDTMDVGGGHIVKRYEDDMLWNGGKLSRVIDAPELFKAYPQLKDVRIDTDAIMNDMPSNGEYNSKTNTITIHANELKYMNGILNHEIQHAIQDIEGFAKGGSPRLVRGEVKKRFDEVTKQIKQLRAEGKEDEAKALIEKNRGLYDAYMKNDDFNSYKSLAGEVEARNVQERMNMTPEERRKILAESTEDVARKDQILLGVGDVSFSLRDMADGKESGAADMAEDLKSLNTPDEVDDAIKTAIEDMPSGWKMANKKMIHIAQALGENRKAEIAGEEPKFSLKDGTLIKAGTYFSGGGLVEEGLKGIIDPVVAVEYDEKISGVYRNNFGQHIVTADVRDVDPKELVKQIDGEVEYFHASPVCKNYSQAKSNHAEVELDKETAASTAEFINAVKPRVVTIENVKGYKDSDAMKIITDALDANGYTWDADVYNAADYGGYTNRERLIVRAVRDGKLPAKPEKMAHKSGWYEAVADIIPTLTEKKNGVAPWMDIRLKADGIDWRNIDKPLYVMGSAYADGKVPHAFADELLPTLRTKSGDVIVMPDGKVYRSMGRVLARVSGVSDDYKMPFSENLSHIIIGNGIPTQLTEHVIAPLLTGSDPKFSIRTYHGTGASFDKFDLSHALEGEGSETFGHGVYVTNSSKIGREYAQRAKQRKMADLYKNMRYPDGVKGDIFKRRVFGEMVNDVATGGSVASAKEFAKKRVGADANDIQRTLENLKDREKGTEYEQNLKDRLAEYKDALKWIDSIDEDYLTQGNANRYDVDIPDDNGNYLGWNDSQNFPLEKWYRLWEITHHGFNENEYFKDGGARYDKDRIERIIQMKLDSPENGMQRLPTLKGEELYHALEDFFDRERPSHGAELASRALSEIGFVGIKYPAGLIHGGAEEGDYNYVIFDENNANIVGNTKFSLRGSTPYDKQMEEWMEKNHLEKGAVPMEKPIMKEGENIFDYANRMVEWTRNQNLWKTAPKQTGFQDALDKWKADNGLSPDAYPPVRPHRENYSTEIGYAEDLEEYNKKKELWKSAPKPKDFDLSVDLEDMNKQLRNIRRAVLNQKNYDQRTVKAVSDLVRKMLNIGWGDGLSRGKVGNLLSAAKNATGANDVKKYLDKAMGILAENYLNRLSTAYDNLINTKGARADQSGVIKMGSLDAKGQAFMSEYKKAMNMDDKSLNTYIANIEEDSAKNEDNVEMNDYRLAGIQAAIMYKQQIGGNDADIAELKRQIAELKNKKDATKEDKDLLKSLEKKLFENKFDRITMYENLLNNIQRMVKESKGRAKEFREEIAEHKNEILHRANLDLEGVDSTYYDTTTAKKKLVNNDLQRAVFSSTYTFEQFLKFFGKKAANGEGYLYNYFTKLNQDALDEEQLYNEMNRNALDEKTKELFGKDKFMNLVGIDGKNMKEMDVEVTDYSNKETGKRTIHLKQGQMLYIYLVNKETDGEMKLRAMGITEEDVAAIEENLDPRVKAMGEWLQDEYLPECQRRYQATHTKYFGAPMKEVENYFPLAINNRARNVKEDVNQDSDAISQLAGTSTGAIVTRRVNVIPLDIENADAFEVAFNHLQEMEEWSAMLPFRQDINTLLSYTHFRNQVQNMSSVAYGSGKTLWNEFKQTAQIAAGTYKPKVNAGMMDSRIAAAMGGIAVAKISGRLWTAIKQSQSATVFLPECDFTRFVKNGVNPYGSWKWAMENIPDFRKRVENMTYGDVKLRQYLDELEKWHDWTKTISKIGMAPNILVDGITCAVGARSVYETEVNRLSKLGYPKEKAEEKAYYKAVAAYNKTQQSSGGMYLSPMQVDRTYVSAALSLFKNANYAYGRMQIEACRGLARTYDFWGGKHKTTLIESMTRQIMEEDGLDENTARAIAKATYNRTFRQSIGRLINFATLVPVSWALYKVLPYLLTGDDDDKKKDMIEEAVLKGFATSLSDNYVIPFASNILNAGLKVEDGKPTFDPEVFRYQNLYINPATSDLANIYSMVGNQKWYSVANKLGMLGVQSLIGFNPETVGALYQAVSEADYDNGNTAKEWQIGILKAISAPEESIRELYMDELGLKSGDIKKIPLAELEKRYAERQINRDNLLSQIVMDAETFNGYVDKYQKSFEKKIKDKMDKWDEYDKKKADEFFDTTSDPKLKDMIEKKRTKDANAAADEQIAKEGLNQEKKGKEPSEEAYDEVKMSIDVAEDNAISTYNKVLNKRYAALNDEYNNQTDAMKYIFMSKHPNFKSYKDLESEYTTYGKKMKELKEKLVSADGYDAKQTILKQIRVEREKFSELQSKVR